MSSRKPASKLDAEKNYTIPQFLDLCKLDEQVTEFVIMRIVSSRISRGSQPRPDQITATGAEFLDAIERSRRVVKNLRRRPMFLQIPGGGQINLSEPMPPLFTPMFKNLRK